MRKILNTIVVASILSASTAVPAFADSWEGTTMIEAFRRPLWPIVAVLSVPAAVIDTVTHIAFPFPGIGYPQRGNGRTRIVCGPANFAPTAYAGLQTMRRHHTMRRE